MVYSARQDARACAHTRTCIGLDLFKVDVRKILYLSNRFLAIPEQQLVQNELGEKFSKFFKNNPAVIIVIIFVLLFTLFNFFRRHCSLLSL